MDELIEGQRMLSTSEDEGEWRKLTEFMHQSMMALDGLWFLNVMKELGPEKTLEIDVNAITGQFKLATRLWRKMMQLDGKSIEDKRQIFEAMSRLYGHKKYQISTDGKKVYLRLHRCGILDHLKRTHRADKHDCRHLCRQLAPQWFKTIEPRTKGEGSVDLQLPVGGPHCDWTIVQPADDAGGGDSPAPK